MSLFIDRKVVTSYLVERLITACRYSLEPNGIPEQAILSFMSRRFKSYKFGFAIQLTSVKCAMNGYCIVLQQDTLAPGPKTLFTDERGEVMKMTQM